MKPAIILWAHWHSPGIVKHIWRATVNEIRMNFYANEAFFGMIPQTVRIEIEPQGPVFDHRFAPRTEYVQYRFEKECTQTVRYRPSLPWRELLGTLYIPKPTLPTRSPAVLLIAISAGENAQEMARSNQRKLNRSKVDSQPRLFNC